MQKDAAASTGIRYIAPASAEALVAGILGQYGVPEPDVATTAHCLVRADLRGVDTHGITRMPGYLERLDLGLIDPAPQLEPERVAPAVARLDGKNGLGFVVASRAVDEALAIAEESGVGLVGVVNSTHFGMAANYLLQAAERGYASLIFTNASPAMPPWGGRAALIGTSPFGAGFPAGAGGVPFILDMSPAVAARGKIRRALREGRSIPEGWALDENGRPTTDPEAALRGVVMPMGGPKGSGLSMLMDILCGVFTGAAFAGEVGDQYKVFDRPQWVGHFMLAIRPDLFLAREAISARMDAFVDRMKANPLADGFDEVMIAGEPEARLEAQRLREGIPYRAADLLPLVQRYAATGRPLPDGFEGLA
ncbi:Ldh family oxidoreductase [Alkalilacustris brevis]|uniref:Ldh family oxidoreductase n=1 Tax=Alkalilacustris brevis TaxID=2026338 RepID=UPI000E0D33BB|nr:Ldh family oxidoreductase [Alkalilacustris brevis]